ncbi:GDP/GTP exchange factor sec2p domain-containing protein [Sarocladium implicatum]|jgi:DNA repair exonuclease SbcCD ATPase subunit|nr:GDP/GTP exchange factor sec2p domain-containing protein [Sarocladium implicatum]
MSTTTTTTAVLNMGTTTLRVDPSQSCCPGCGIDLPHSDLSNADEASLAEASKAQARISELETQVRLLNQKASAAVDRWADYEDEIARLRSQQKQQQQQQQSKSLAPSPEPASPARTSFIQTGTNRLSQLLSARKSTPNLHESTPNDAAPRPPMPRAASTPDAQDLIAALTREKSLRKEAEGKLTATSREVEELSVSLFEQANEMVATERRARAALEERVGELERRDREKARRLERLEKAMGRIERVKVLLNET